MVQFHSFPYGYPVVPAAFIKKTVLSPLIGFCTLKNQQTIYVKVWRLFCGFSFLFIWSLCLSFCKYYTVLKEAMVLIIVNLKMINFCLFSGVLLYFIYVLGNWGLVLTCDALSFFPHGKIMGTRLPSTVFS